MQKAAGYILDVSYPAHFHREMQPVWLTALANFLGMSAPDIARPCSYCELGCGVGVNLLVAAATNPCGEFVGVDINGRHLAVARAAARAIGLDNVRFVQADFARFARENNLFFDFIASHGVWSWIAPPQQQAILQLVAKALKPRGLLYLHYMCHPGATQLLPVQKLLLELAPGLPGTSAEQMAAGLDLLLEMDAAGAFVDQPRLSRTLRNLRQQNMAYLAHDLLADHWRPFHAADMQRLLAQAGATHLGSADPFENLEALSVPGRLQPLLARQTSPAVRATLQDIARNQHQRHDLFQREPLPLEAAAALAQLDRLQFQRLPAASRAEALLFRTPIGAIPGPPALFAPLQARLWEGPASFAELRQLPAFASDPAVLAQALQMLMWQAHAHPLRPDAAVDDAASRARVAKLNDWIAAARLALQVVAACGTAVHRVVAPDSSA